MLHIHITINETSPQIYKEAISQISTVLQHIATRTNLLPKIINIGGGYEVYDPGLKPEFVKLFEEIKQAFRKHLGGYKIAIEPGRYLSAYAGYAIGKVLDIKQIAQKYWIVTDIGTNTLIPNPNARYKLAEPITNHSSGMFRIGITDGITSPANNIVFETRIDKLPDIGSYICIENTGAYTDVYSTFWAYPPYITCSVDNDGKMRVYRSEEDIEQLQSIIFK